MKTVGKNGLALIKSFEGCRLAAYTDVVGVWTIGYGHTGKVNGRKICAGMKITQADADALLTADCQTFADYVDNPNYCPFTAKLNGNQRDALISFAFNCGAGNLKKLCSGRTVDTVADAFVLYNKAGGRVLAGLTRRRNAEKSLYNEPVDEYKNPYTAPTRTLKRGSSGVGVKWLQEYLNHYGARLAVDGDFGACTESAVIEYQTAHGLTVDGIVGQETRKALKNGT